MLNEKSMFISARFDCLCFSAALGLGGANRRALYRVAWTEVNRHTPVGMGIGYWYLV